MNRSKQPGLFLQPSTSNPGRSWSSLVGAPLRSYAAFVNPWVTRDLVMDPHPYPALYLNPTVASTPAPSNPDEFDLDLASYGLGLDDSTDGSLNVTFHESGKKAANGADYDPGQHVIQVYVLSQPCQAVALILLIFLAVVFNVCVVANIRRCSLKLRTTHFLLVQHLCVADIGGALGVLPVPLVSTIRGRWDGGEALCTFSSAVNVALWLQHILLFLSIKVDRVLASFLPIGRYPLCSADVVAVLVSGLWLISLGVAAAVSSSLGADFERSVLLCVPRMPREFGITIFSLYCSAFAAMVVGYVIVIIILRRQESRAQDRQAAMIVTLPKSGPAVPFAQRGVTSPSGQSLVRAAMTSLIVTASHLLLYVPTLLMLGLQGAVQHPVAVFICALVVYAEFLVHPTVLLMTSAKLRSEVHKALVDRLKRCWKRH